MLMTVFKGQYPTITNKYSFHERNPAIQIVHNYGK